MSRSTIRSASLKPFSTSPKISVSAASASVGNLPASTMRHVLRRPLQRLHARRRRTRCPASRPFGAAGTQALERIDHERQRLEVDDDLLDRFGGDLFAVGGDREDRLAFVERFLRQREFRGRHRRRRGRGGRRRGAAGAGGGGAGGGAAGSRRHGAGAPGRAAAGARRWRPRRARRLAALRHRRRRHARHPALRAPAARQAERAAAAAPACPPR